MRQASIITTVIVLMCTIPSCIFEDRSNCPACLILDFSETPETVSCINIFLEQDNGIVITDTIPKEDFGKRHEISVRRGSVHIAAFGNAEGMLHGNTCTVETGNDAENIYTCFFSAEYHGDIHCSKIRMLKNNIGLHIRVKGTVRDSISVLIESSSVGYGLHGQIIEGCFRHVPEPVHRPSENGEYFGFTARATRQKNDDLTLYILSDSGKELAAVPLHDCLTEAGINMDDMELGDLFLFIDIASLHMTVSSVGWTDTCPVEIII